MTTFNAEQKKKLDEYWKTIGLFRDQYFQSMHALEKNIQDDLKIDDLEIFFSDGEAVGFGNYSRTYKLYQPED